MKLYHVSFSTKKYENAQKICFNNLITYQNIDFVVPFTRDWLEQTNFYKENKTLLDLPRGAGYWAWKPFIILEVLKVMNEGDVVLYSDCGDLLHPNIGNYIKNYLLTEEVLLVSSEGPMFKQKIWTKKECFVQMNCDENKYKECLQLEAGVVAFKKCNKSINLVKEWLNYCLIPSIINDEKDEKIQLQEFKDHRHDQSILTNLVIKHNLCVNDGTIRNYIRCNYYN